MFFFQDPSFSKLCFFGFPGRLGRGSLLSLTFRNQALRVSNRVSPGNKCPETTPVNGDDTLQRVTSITQTSRAKTVKMNDTTKANSSSRKLHNHLNA